MKQTFIGTWDEDDDTFFTGRVIAEHADGYSERYYVGTPIEEIIDLRSALDEFKSLTMEFQESFEEARKADDFWLDKFQDDNRDS